MLSRNLMEARGRQTDRQIAAISHKEIASFDMYIKKKLHDTAEEADQGAVCSSAAMLAGL